MVSFRKKSSGASSDIKKKSQAMTQSYKILGKGLTQAVLMAKSKHRFKPKSGNLERSIVSEVTRVGKFDSAGLLAIKDSIASYGYWVSKGHGTWKADPFLENAKNKWFKIIDNNIKKLLR